MVMNPAKKVILLPLLVSNEIGPKNPAGIQYDYFGARVLLKICTIRAELSGGFAV